MGAAQNLTALEQPRPILSRNTVVTDKIVEGDRLINVHEAARISGLKEVSLYNAANPKLGNKLHAVRDSRGHVFFSEQEVRKVFGDSPVDRRKEQYKEPLPFVEKNVDNQK